MATKKPVTTDDVPPNPAPVAVTKAADPSPVSPPPAPPVPAPAPATFFELIQIDVRKVLGTYDSKEKAEAAMRDLNAAGVFGRVCLRPVALEDM